MDLSSIHWPVADKRIETWRAIAVSNDHAARIGDNAGVFDFQLDADAVSELDALDAGLATGWDPRKQP